MKLHGESLTMLEPDRESAADETEGGGAGLLAALMWVLAAITAGLFVAGMMAAG